MNGPGTWRPYPEAVQDNELRAFLQHAKVPLANKLQVISEAFSSADHIVQNLVSLLISRGRTGQVGQVEDWYLRLLNQRRQGGRGGLVCSGLGRRRKRPGQEFPGTVALRKRWSSHSGGPGNPWRPGDAGGRQTNRWKRQTRLERMGRQLQRETMETGA